MGNGQGKPVNFSGEVNLNHFRLLRVVGKGAFGKVRIVERKDTGLTFALKYIRKDEVVRSESVRNIIRERRMLQHLNHPFICNLRYSFQDIEYMYLVVDLMNGGDLRFHISRKTFTEEAIRFWIAELGCALRYIHKQGIIHRDVKPDNVLLDSEGHIHLADFNVASDFTPGKLLTSKSGTLAYLAPEVYKGKGYSSGADWWSLGVLFYECIYSKRPFEGSTQSMLSLQITQAAPKFPVTSPPVSMPCLHAISSALEEDVEKRMGAVNFESFSDNPFFRSIDFEALERKEIEPVFVPSSEKTNFDATYDLEELLLEEAPLEARARRQKPREALKEDATEKEVREDELYKMIETLFLPFDYTTAAYDRYSEASGPGTSGNPADWTQPPPIHPTTSTEETLTRTVSSRSHSRRRRSTKSQPSTPTGSPRLPTDTPPLPNGQPTSQSPTSSPQSTETRRPRQLSKVQNPLPPYHQPYNRPTPAGTSRKESVAGGVSVVLGAEGSWSDLAKQDATLPADAKLIAATAKPTGMLGFLNRKKGRGHSPKPQERGILGKEGARVIISSGS
ncbi:hypothetical protein M430DRAFT_225191 [Amorphotheca resinae ATCC 22711]|uniref:Protein kinase domain-containing protein n=1 Tax=Amorphotheca resinae ATCC 22711 TaxID=857342 RepID=A0A2T3B6N4_AMORE|nr:hypothetical protein M430DRAFT_225191 [Amorphotheca resinae ATCC 22711]PSS22406.1 hypothetical protein M430DRAFT_225191 [Amorphotheca resinae ATCC 22711]